jgi:ribose transport system permease protein
LSNDTAKPVAETDGPTVSAPRRVLGTLLNYGMIWVLILLAIFASILYPGFLAPANLNNMFSQVAPVGIVALGMTYVIIAGGFDLSVTAIFAAATVSYASLSNSLPLWVAFLATVVLGIFCGIINGLVITALRVNPFIATLSTSSLFAGATYLYSKNLPIQADDPAFQDIGLGTIGQIWVSIFILAGFIIVSWIVLSRTTYGRAVYAVGGNQEAARLAGMRVNLVKVSTYCVTGICAAVAGMITASQIGVGQPTLGTTITLDSIAIVIIGGTSLLGGEGAIWRTVIGLSIWAMINNLFSALAISTGARLVMVGLIVLVAVALDTWTRSTRR